MSAKHLYASRAYASTGLETTIADASPEQLILMLHNGLIESLHRAKLAMGEGRIAEKGEAISRSLAILTEGLMPALDTERGGSVAANLASLYEYMITRLMIANLKNEAGHVDEVTRLVQELKGAWEQLSMNAAARSAAAAPAEPRLAAAGVSMSFGAA